MRRHPGAVIVESLWRDSINGKLAHAVATDMTSPIWPTPMIGGQIVILGLQ